MKKRLLGFCFLLAACPSTASAPSSVPWVGSFKEAKAQAQAANQPILLFLKANYCEWCRLMEQTTFQDSRVRLLAAQFTPCRLNGEREGKPLIQKYQVAEYPFLAIIGSEGDLQAKSVGYANSDQCAAFLVANLPKGSITRLKGLLTVHPEQADAQATLGVIYAERNLLAQAVQARAACAAEGGSPPDLAAVNHALGLAYSTQGDDAQALRFLQAAASEAQNPHEIVRLHFLLADAFSRLHRNSDARAELEAVRHLKGATRDEKGKAKTRELRLTALLNP